MFRMLLGMLLVLTGTGANAAARDRAICQGPTPAAGAVVHGPVLFIPDGSSVCVAVGGSPSTWVKIALPGPSATRSSLMAAAFAKNAACLIRRDGTGRCLIEGVGLPIALDRPEVIKTAASWR